MNAVREAWTDERLDDLNDRVDQGFAQVDNRFQRVDERFEQVDKRFEQVDKRFEQVDKRFDRVEDDLRELRTEMNGRFDRLQWGMFAFAGTISAAVIASPHI